MNVVAAIALVVLIAGCVPGARLEPTFSDGYHPIWTVTGTTAERSLHDATYFNDRGAPHLHAGEVVVAWRCIGAGTLQVSATAVAGRGGLAPPSGAAALSAVLSCPSLVADGTLRWKLLPGLALGGENVLIIRPGLNGAQPISYTIVLAQG